MALVLTVVAVESLVSLCVVWWLLRSAAASGSREAAPARIRAVARASAMRTRDAVRLRRPSRDEPRVLTRRQAAFTAGVAVAIGCGVAVAAVPTIAVLDGVLIVFFMAAYSFKLVLIGVSVRHRGPLRAAASRTPPPAEELPVYTILLPLYREASVLPQLIAGIRGLHYPPEKLDVKVLLEADDLETREAAEALDLPDCFEVLLVPDDGPAGKARASNYGLSQARGDFLVIFDAEDCPEPDQLVAVVNAFRDQPPDVVCLQARLNCFNREHNLLTRMFTAEYSVWFDQLLPGLAEMDAPIPLGGTSNHFVTARLRELGGWDEYNVTEDAELGMRIFLSGLRTGLLDTTTFEEAIASHRNWLKQRSRWIKGYMQTYLHYMRRPIEAWRQMGTLGFGVFQLFFGANTLCLLLNPIYWALVAIWFAWRPAWIQSIFPGPVFYLALFGLFVGNAACMVAMVSGCYTRRNYADVKWALLSPLYWLLMSVAAYKALAQLVYKPWYWEKTEHGFFSIAEVAEPLPQAERRPRPAAAATRQAAPQATLERGSAMRPGFGGRLGRYARRRLSAPLRHELTVVATVAALCALVAFIWSDATHSLVLYDDAAAHLDVARRVSDGLSEGLAQLGSVWLPLPHLMLAPFVAINALWHSGIAGAIVSAACFVYATVRIYSLVRELSGSRAAAWCAFAVMAVNLNLLYIQTTALTEPVLIAFIVGAVFHFARWMRSFSMAELLWAAVFTVAATLTRYEGWGLLAAEAIAIVVWGRLADRRRSSPQANAVLFAAVGSYGVGLWFLYNLVIFGSPLYFLSSAYSAEKINGGQAQFGLLATKDHLGTTLLTFGWDLVDVIGPVVIIATAVALLLAFVPSPRRRRQIMVLGLLAAPVVFDLVSLYVGQITIRVPQVAPHNMWNDLYALIALPLCATAIGLAAAHSRIRSTAAAGVVAAGLAVMSLGTPITLADGRHGISSQSRRASLVVATELKRDYHGGRILADDLFATSAMFESGLDLKQFVSPGFHPYWERALASPASQTRWVLAYPGDAVAQDLAAHPRRFAAFRLILAAGGARLYESRRYAAATEVATATRTPAGASHRD